jgi:endonuclease III
MENKEENFDETLEEISQEYPEELESLKREYKNVEIVRPVITVEELERECEGNEILEKLLKEAVDSFYRYTETVCEFHRILSQSLTDKEVSKKFQELDKKREIVNKALTKSVNALAEALKKFGKKSDWIEKLGPETNRVAYANLALQNTYLQLMKLEIAKPETQKEEINYE